MTAPHRFVLEAGNPYDLTREDLEPLAALLLSTDPDFDVEISERPERGYGVTLHEVLNIYLDASAVAANLGGSIALFQLAVKWARARWQEEREEHPAADTRPRSVTIYGPDGKALKAVVIDLPEGEPSDVEDPPSSPTPPPTSD